MIFNNTCNCLVDYQILENSIIQECLRKGITPKQNYKIYIHRGYSCISIKHDKVDVHRIIGNYINGNLLNSNIFVHHKNGNKFDNQLDNLEILTNSEHIKIHKIYQKADINKLKQNAIKGCISMSRKDFTKQNVIDMKNKGLTYLQISSILNCGYNTVKRRIHENQPHVI
jgi:hypothetical protein